MSEPQPPLHSASPSPPVQPPPITPVARGGGRIGPFVAGVAACLAVVLVVVGISGALGGSRNATAGASVPPTLLAAPAPSSAPAGSPSGSSGLSAPSGAPSASGSSAPSASSAPGGSAAATATDEGIREAVPALVTLPPIAMPAASTPATQSDGYALGSATAPVTVEVWEDFQCPYCRKYSAEVEPQVIATYVQDGRARYIFRSIPFLGDESGWAAVAADLAAAQGRFWPFHDYLFANQLGENVGSFTLSRLRTIADAVGLDRTAFDAGMSLDHARATYAKLRSEVSPLVNGTPTIVVNGKPVPGADWTSVKAAIDAALAAAQPSATGG